MRPIDKLPGYDDWLTKDLPDDEPQMTDDEVRQQREHEQDRRWIEEIFR